MNLNQEVSRSNNFTHQDFASVLDRYKYQLSVGDITGGTIFSQEKQGFLVDIGEHVAAYLPQDEINVNKYKKTVPLINNSREFFILAYSKKSKQLILSIKRLEYIRGWQRVKQIKQEDAIISLYVDKVNKGGLIAALEGIQGFIPNSHIVNIQQKKSLINQKIKCQIVFINEKTNTIILSQKRAALKNLLPKIYIGQSITGRIARIQAYGVFVNICGFLALLHISEIGNTANATKVFHIGQSIDVQIIHIDTRQGRLSVSRRHIAT